VFKKVPRQKNLEDLENRYDKLLEQDLTLMLETALMNAAHQMDNLRKAPRDDKGAHLSFLTTELNVALHATEALRRKVGKVQRL
jgi:hypothetical protein